MNRYTILTAGALVIASGSAFAANGPTIGAMDGQCIALIAFDSATACDTKIVNMEFPNGRNGFLFFTSDKKVVVSFFGDGHKQLHPDADTAVQPVDHVNITIEGQLQQIDGAGACRFTNPFKGVATVSCTADTVAGKFGGEFRSNGRAPERVKG